MTPKIAFAVALLILGAAIADAMANDWRVSIWLGRQLLEWLNWLAVWRRL